MQDGPGKIAIVLLLVVAATLSGCGGSSPPESTQNSAENPPPPPRPTAETKSAAPSPAGSSRITGTVTFSGPIPTLKPVQMSADPGCQKKHSQPIMPDSLVLGEGNTLGNVFVRVKAGLAGSGYAAPSTPVVLDQRGCRYVPHVVGVMVAQPFLIRNSDGLLHNVHALPQLNRSFNRAMPAAVTEAQFSFDREEVMFRVKCDVHPWMGAYVGVVAHPYFDVTAEDGGYSIPELPAGTYVIEAWHEKLGTQQQTLKVADGETQTADFLFSR